MVFILNFMLKKTNNNSDPLEINAFWRSVTSDIVCLKVKQKEK